MTSTSSPSSPPAAGESGRCAERRATGPAAASATASCSSPTASTANSRAALVDGGSCWGGLIVTRDTGRPDFSGEETDFFSRALASAGQGAAQLDPDVRGAPRARARRPRTGRHRPTRRSGRASESAVSWLQELDEGTDELPAAVLSTAKSGPARRPRRDARPLTRAHRSRSLGRPARLTRSQTRPIASR